MKVDLILEKEDLIEHDANYNRVKVDKSIFDDYNKDTFVNIQFVENNDNVYQYKMISEDADGIIMEIMDSSSHNDYL